jgi:hypothetical protein
MLVHSALSTRREAQKVVESRMVEPREKASPLTEVLPELRQTLLRRGKILFDEGNDNPEFVFTFLTQFHGVSPDAADFAQNEAFFQAFLQYHQNFRDALEDLYQKYPTLAHFVIEGVNDIPQEYWNRGFLAYVAGYDAKVNELCEIQEELQSLPDEQKKVLEQRLEKLLEGQRAMHQQALRLWEQGQDPNVERYGVAIFNGAMRFFAARWARGEAANLYGMEDHFGALRADQKIDLATIALSGLRGEALRKDLIRQANDRFVKECRSRHTYSIGVLQRIPRYSLCIGVLGRAHFLGGTEDMKLPAELCLEQLLLRHPGNRVIIMEPHGVDRVEELKPMKGKFVTINGRSMTVDELDKYFDKLQEKLLEQEKNQPSPFEKM